IENTRVLCAHGFLDLALDLQNLLARGDERFFEALQLGRNLLLGDNPAGEASGFFPEHEDRSPSDSSGDGDSAVHFFPRSRKLSHIRFLPVSSLDSILSSWFTISSRRL